MKTKTQILNNVLPRVFWALVALIVFVMAIYIYFVNTAILHAAERSRAEENAIVLKTTVSELEFEFIEKTRGMTEEYALSHGFEIKDPRVFVTRDPDTKLSLLDTR